MVYSGHIVFDALRCSSAYSHRNAKTIAIAMTIPALTLSISGNQSSPDRRTHLSAMVTIEAQHARLAVNPG
jgi:hypothetical protein